MKKFFVVVVTLIVCLLVVAAGGWFYSNPSSNPLSLVNPPPVIQIAMPADGTVISSGQGMALAAEAVSETGLSRVDFMVDGDVAQQHFPTTAGATFDAPVFVWFGVKPGWHKLGVVAYDSLGRASPEDNVQVGVVAGVGGGAPPNGGEQPAAQAGGDGVANPPEGGGQPPVSPENPNQPADQIPPDGQNPPEIPPQPQDNPPEVSGFMLFTSVSAEGVVTVAAMAEGMDDLGVQRLILKWQNDAGPGEVVSVFCAGAQDCHIQHSTVLAPGEWLFSVQAFDTSGQASLPSVRVVQVLAHEGLPPAVADDVLDGGLFSDWFADHWRDVGFNPDFDGFDLGDAWRDQLGNGEGIEAGGQCLTYLVEPLIDGIRHTLTVDCDLQTEEGDEFLMPLVHKNSHDLSAESLVPEWWGSDRARIAAGESFTWVDNNVTCGASYSYTVTIVSATERGWLLPGWRAPRARADISTLACSPGSMGDVNLRAEIEQGNVRILWNWNGGDIWPANLPPEGVTFKLISVDLDTQQSSFIYQGNITADMLQAGGNHSVLDPYPPCGNRHEYILTGIAANADLEIASPDWLLRAHTPAPEQPCSPGSLAAIELTTQPYWLDNELGARLSMQIPPDFNFPGEGELVILRTQQGNNNCLQTPCTPFWNMVEYIPITAQIRQQGLDYVGEDHDSLHGGVTYAYELGFAMDHHITTTGRSFAVTMPKEPPPAPVILWVAATNQCPAGVPRCVIIEWSPYQGPDADHEYFTQADKIYVQRTSFEFNPKEFLVGMEDTRYVDTDPPMREMRWDDGSIGQSCNFPIFYNMVVYDANGHSSKGQIIEIQTPDCNDPWNVIAEAR